MFLSKRIIPICAIAAGMALVGVTSGFTKAPKTSSDDPTTYFFEYQENEAVNDPASWKVTTNSIGCGGTEKSCKIELSKNYVDENSVPISINASTLPSGLLPTTLSSTSHEVPDDSSPIYEHIFNQD